jgi:hypothetical protein
LLDEMVTASVQRFENAGFKERFEAAPGGLRSEQTGLVHAEQDLVPLQVVALGTPLPGSGPTLLFVLRSRLDGARGTWVVCRDAGLSGEAQHLFDRLASADPKRTWTERVPLGGSGPGQFVLEGMMAGLIGASIVALWFLLVDVVRREAFFTPALLGARLFGGGAEPETLTIDLAQVAGVIVLHGALFMLLGIAAAWLVTRHIERPTLASLFAGLLLTIHGGFLISTRLLIPGTTSIIGHSEIFVGNVFAAIAMAEYLRRTLPRPAHPERAPTVRLHAERSR